MCLSVTSLLTKNTYYPGHIQRMTALSELKLALLCNNTRPESGHALLENSSLERGKSTIITEENNTLPPNALQW